MHQSNRKALNLLFIANSVSGVAQGISMIAIPWYFTSILGKASLFSTSYVFINLAMIFWSLYAGTLIDKYNRKTLSLGVSIFGAVVLLTAAAIGFFTGTVPVLVVILVFGSTFLIYNVHYPNLYAFAQEITPVEHYGKMTSQIEIVGQLTSMMAGACAALLLAGSEDGIVNLLGFSIPLGIKFNAWQLQHVFLLDGATYVLSFFIIYFIRYQPFTVRHAEAGNVWERLKTGLAFLKKHPVIFTFGNVALAIFLTVIVSSYVMNPAYVVSHLKGDAGVYGASEMYFAIGAVFAGIMIRRIFRKWPEVNAILLMTIVAAVIYFLSIINRSFFIFYFFNLIYGLCNAGTRIMRITFMFHYVPNQVIGRAGSVFSTINIILRMIFSAFFALAFFTGENIVYTYLVFGIMLLIAVYFLIRDRKKLVQLSAAKSQFG
ncbi:MAG: MFS transporter [Chitinophagales bacterium]